MTTRSPILAARLGRLLPSGPGGRPPSDPGTRAYAPPYGSAHCCAEGSCSCWCSSRLSGWSTLRGDRHRHRGADHGLLLHRDDVEFQPLRRPAALRPRTPRLLGGGCKASDNGVIGRSCAGSTRRSLLPPFSSLFAASGELTRLRRSCSPRPRAATPRRRGVAPCAPRSPLRSAPARTPGARSPGSARTTSRRSAGCS